MGRFYIDRQHMNTAATKRVSRYLCLAASVAVASVMGISTTPTTASAQHMPPPSGGPLQLNDSGDAVANLQYQLSTMGYYNGPINGYFDASTQEAVSRFQQDQGLTSDGIVGSSTRQTLYRGAPPANGASNSASSSAFGQGGGQNQSPAATAATPQDSVQLNASGAQVTELQNRLAELGYYNGSISGTFDYETEAAVMQFQRDQGLATDGVVGPSTAASLRRPAAEITKPTASPNQPNQMTEASQEPNGVVTNPDDDLLGLGETGQSVSDLQLRLKELGFYQGEVTGTYGPETEAAVIAFQQSHGLITDGIAGPQVIAALSDFGGSTSGNASASSSSTASPSSTASADSTPSTVSSGSTSDSTGTTSNSAASTASAAAAASNTTPQNSQVTMEQLEQARQEAEQAQLQAQQAQAVLAQNLEEGNYSIAILQRQLQQQGYYPGEINGMLTAQTQTAIAAAQQHYRLSPSDMLSSTGMGSVVPASSTEVRSAAPSTPGFMPEMPPTSQQPTTPTSQQAPSFQQAPTPQQAPTFQQPSQQSSQTVQVDSLFPY